jgi:enamine deaminase RidA (YjgF/YER057c/UK114 family)
MAITRINPQPRWSDAVVFNRIVWFVEVADDPSANIEGQILQIFAQAESRLAAAGSSKKSICAVTIYFTDHAHLPVLNQLWEKWLPEGCAPVRAAVKAELVDPSYLIEFQFTAAQE